MNGGEGIAGAPARGRLASRFLFIAMILIAGFTAPRAAPCQDAARLEARIALGHPWVRENAPVPVRITMKGNEPRPRAGRLQIDFDDPAQGSWRVTSRELLLGPEETILELTLPPIPRDPNGVDTTLRLTFLTEGRQIDLGAHPLAVSRGAPRRLIVTLVAPRGSRRRHAALIGSLKLEGLDPQAPAELYEDLATVTLNVEPSALPTDPLGLLGSDLIVLSPEGLAELAAEQLGGLARWVRAGGSLALLLGRGLDEHHLAFLRELAGDRSWRLGEWGQIEAGAGGSVSGFSSHRVDLGRILIVSPGAPLLDDLTREEWRRQAAFLWKVRAAEVEGALDHRKWNSGAPWERGSAAQPGMRGGLRAGSPLTANGATGLERDHSPLSQLILDAMVPREVTIIPLGWVVIIVILFLLVVGPVDYKVLGRLGRRWLTWILFPLVATLFTLALIGISHIAVSGGLGEEEIILIDVGEGPRVLRKNGFRLVLRGSTGDPRTVGRAALISALGTSPSDALFLSFLRPNGIPRYEGALPGSYELHQRIHKWSPQLYREASFDEENPHPDLRWDLLDPRRFDELEYRQGILARLFPGAPAGVAGLLAHGGGLDRSPWEFLSMGDPDALPQRALMAMRWPQESGLLALVARTSPEGGPLLDDIHMLDWTDEGEWLLMVAIPDGERTLLYRRLYHEEER